MSRTILAGQYGVVRLPLVSFLVTRLMWLPARLTVVSTGIAGLVALPKLLESLPSIGTDDDRASELFPIISSESPITELSRTLFEMFPNVDFSQLHIFHEWMERRVFPALNIRLGGTLGGVFAAIGALFTIIPGQVNEDVSFWAFWVTVGFLVYLSVLILPFWLLVSLPAKRRNQYVGAVIEYTAVHSRSSK